MRKFLTIFTALFLFISPVFAYDASDTGWQIDDFHSQINVSKDQKVKVRETIKVDFGDLSKHGIYRYIPYKYSRKSNNYNVRIQINSVENDHGVSIPYQESRRDGNLILQIGDEDKLISGAQTYRISYDLERVINHFSDSSEFYFNVTGSDWPVPIKSVSAELNWPDDAKIKDNICYVGGLASNIQDCDKSINNNAINFKTQSQLSAGEGFTIASSIEPGVIIPYPWWQTASWFLADNWGYLLPILTLAILLFLYFRGGRDPKGRQTIAPEFAPPNELLPAELGTIYDEKVDAKDISAVIIDLAVKGYLTIKEVKTKAFLGTSTDYEFSRTKKLDKNLGNYEKEILNAVFEDGDTSKMSDLDKTFFEHVKGIHQDLYDKVLEDGYFSTNPQKIRNIFRGIGITIIVISFWIMSNNLSIFIGLIASGLLFLIFSFAMSKRTDKGVETNRQIKGFRMYMFTAERYRQKFFEDKHIFEKFLPYAMVFGITKKWAEAFKGLDVPRPSWYSGQGNFYPIVFVASLDNFQNSANSTLITPSSAGTGGSGFSGGGVGGGFGGGGGGSW